MLRDRELARRLGPATPSCPENVVHDGSHTPRLPGVYLAREGATGELVYVGMAGERRGQGIRERLTIYARGKALASGLGEAVFDRALADPEWLRDRLTESNRAMHSVRPVGECSPSSAPTCTSAGQ